MNGSIHIYSVYHRLMLTHSPTELYSCNLGGFHLTKRDIPNYRRPIVGSPSLNMSWQVSRGEGCQLVVEIAVWQCVNNLRPKLDYNRVCDRTFTIFLIPYITPWFVFNMLVCYSLNVSVLLLHHIYKFLIWANFAWINYDTVNHFSALAIPVN